MAIEHRIKPKYKNRVEATVAKLRAEAGADAPIDPHMKIKKKLAELAYLMALVHGGDWQAVADHEKGYLLVSRRPPWARSSL